MLSPIAKNLLRPAMLAAAILFSSAPSMAQRLIGGAHSPATGPLLASQNVCAPSARRCSPLLAPPAAAFAGGTAYDPRRQVVWNTDGTLLTGVLLLSTTPCTTPHCPAAPAPVPAGALATGLAFDESRDAVWMIDSSPSLSLLRLNAAAPCPALTARCNLAGVIPAAHRPGSLAFSERRQLVLWSSSVFGGGAAANIVYVARAADPCVVICRITLFGTVGCGGSTLGAITGMAYDDCTDRVFVTDGVRVLSAVYVEPCGAINFACCAAALVAPYYGLDLEAEHPARVGAACLQGTCGVCPNFALTTVGDPAIGNPAFALRVNGGPVGGAALFVLDPGPCAAGVPLFCGLYHPAAIPPAFSFAVALAGAGACTASATLPLGIPMMPWACGQKLCAQAVIFCIPGGRGISNALELTLSDT
jgi:hypothetical protein